MDWGSRRRSGSVTYHRDGWVVKHLTVAKCWVVTYKTRTVPDLTFSDGVAARRWVDTAREAQEFAAFVLRQDLDPKLGGGK